MGEAIINRVTEGPVGPTGPTGAKGATGATGSAGSCNIGFGTFSNSSSASFSFSPKAVIFVLQAIGYKYTGIAYGSNSYAFLDQGGSSRSVIDTTSTFYISGNVFFASGITVYGAVLALG